MSVCIVEQGLVSRTMSSFDLDVSQYFKILDRFPKLSYLIYFILRECKVFVKPAPGHFRFYYKTTGTVHFDI